MPAVNGLTDKQERFCLEYLVDLNATQAAIRAGYAESGASVEGTRLLGNAKVSDRVAELQAERVARVKIDADWVLRKSMELHDRTVETGNDTVTAKAIELVGKHVNIQAFRDNIGLQADINAKIDLAGLTDEQLRVLASIGAGK